MVIRARIYLLSLIFIISYASAISAQDIDRGKFGVVSLSEFNPSWLADFPNISTHVSTEHALHVMGLDEKGEGLTWHKEKFVTSGGLDPIYAPNHQLAGSKVVGVQFKLPYFKVPKAFMHQLSTDAVNPHARKVLEIYDESGTVTGYRFFIHPEGFKHFEVLFNTKELEYISPEKSEFIATPTSSYRSLAVRQVVQNADNTWVGAPGSVPVVIKLGVAGEVLGSDRWLSTREIERSINVQRAFDKMKDQLHGKFMKLYIFPESEGIFLNEARIQGYPPVVETKDDAGNLSQKQSKSSGILLREFPQEMLDNKINIYSFAALISAERVKPHNVGMGIHNPNYKGLENLPLIYDLISIAKDKKIVDSTEQYLRTFLIEGYIDTLDFVFKEGLTLEPHSQNYSIVLNNDNVPIGFAYRDLGGVTVDLLTRVSIGKDISLFSSSEDSPTAVFKSKSPHTCNYVSSHAWFYRYQVFNKLLNVLTKPDKDEKGNYVEIMAAPLGAPYQIGFDQPIPERNLYSYIINHLPASDKDATIAQMDAFLMPVSKINDLLLELDTKYYDKMASFFNMDAIQLKKYNGMLYSAEGGSGKEHVCNDHNGFTMNHKDTVGTDDIKKFAFSVFPEDLKENLLDRLILSVPKASLAELNISDFGVGNQGIWYYSNTKVVAFMPYLNTNEQLQFRALLYRQD